MLIVIVILVQDVLILSQGTYTFAFLCVWDVEVSDNDALYDTELDRVRQKLQRAYMRRDHYAQLYYRAMAELDETKWELSVAKNKIQELKSLGQQFAHLCGSLHMPLEVGMLEPTISNLLLFLFLSALRLAIAYHKILLFLHLCIHLATVLWPSWWVHLK